jgi:biopolymer transport protein ExbD
MVITPMLSKGQTVNMVKTYNDKKIPDADKEDAILIAITRDGRAFLSPGNVMIHPEDLGPKVKDLQVQPGRQDCIRESRRARAFFERDRRN